MKLIHFISAVKLMAGLLAILFVLLKLFGVIHLGWVWVFSPFWIAAGFEASVLVFALIAKIILTILVRVTKPEASAPIQDEDLDN